eukprot:Gb_38236 [translate_table: standard]
MHSLCTMDDSKDRRCGGHKMKMSNLKIEELLMVGTLLCSKSGFYYEVVGMTTYMVQNGVPSILRLKHLAVDTPCSWKDSEDSVQEVLDSPYQPRWMGLNLNAPITPPLTLTSNSRVATAQTTIKAATPPNTLRPNPSTVGLLDIVLDGLEGMNIETMLAEVYSSEDETPIPFKVIATYGIEIGEVTAYEEEIEESSIDCGFESLDKSPSIEYAHLLELTTARTTSCIQSSKIK